MDLDNVITRIKDNIPELRTVGGSVEIAVAREDLRTTPAVFVLAATEGSEGNTFGTGGVSQRVTVTFSIVLAVSNYQDSTGKAGHDALQAIRADLMTTLLGWTPPDMVVECEHVQGNLSVYNDSTLWWQDTFKTEFYRRA